VLKKSTANGQSTENGQHLTPKGRVFESRFPHYLVLKECFSIRRSKSFWNTICTGHADSLGPSPCRAPKPPAITVNVAISSSVIVESPSPRRDHVAPRSVYRKRGIHEQTTGSVAAGFMESVVWVREWMGF
jgi:hypothetical protein